MIFDPKADPGLVVEISAMRARGRLYVNECQRRGVRFLPKQVMRQVFSAAEVPDGPFSKPVRLFIRPR